jgi:hypothetical protein
MKKTNKQTKKSTTHKKKKKKKKMEWCSTQLALADRAHEETRGAAPADRGAQELAGALVKTEEKRCAREQVVGDIRLPAVGLDARAPAIGGRCVAARQLGDTPAHLGVGKEPAQGLKRVRKRGSVDRRRRRIRAIAVG